MGSILTRSQCGDREARCVHNREIGKSGNPVIGKSGKWHPSTHSSPTLASPSLLRCVHGADNVCKRAQPAASASCHHNGVHASRELAPNVLHKVNGLAGWCCCGRMILNRARLSNITRNVLNLHETLGAHTRDVLNVHKALGAQHERIAQLEKQVEAMHAQMQTTTPKRKYTTIQDSSPEDTFVGGAEAAAICCHTDLQELIEEMFPQVADVFCFVSDHEAETKRYYAKKQRCNAEPTAQPTAADILGHLADRM